MRGYRSIIIALLVILSVAAVVLLFSLPTIINGGATYSLPEPDRASQESDGVGVQAQDDNADDSTLGRNTENDVASVDKTSVNGRQQEYNFDLADIPEYSGVPYCEINRNIPFFDESDYTTISFEDYSDLDRLGRCGAAYANLSLDTMPTEEREDISSVKPSGWNNVNYSVLGDEYLYNRCHLIAFMLAGENDNEKNLITGTRYFNTEGMLPYERRVAKYIELSGGHVLYRVTPIFRGNDLVASGVEMEGWSVEDDGENICFNVFVYNVQPEIEIDYSTGESRIAE